MTKMRTHLAATCLALACAPGLAAAQDNQLQVMEQAVRICTDALIAHGDWNGVLADWQRTKLAEGDLDKLAALHLYSDIVSQTEYGDHLGPSDDLNRRLAGYYPPYRRDISPDWRDLRVWQHESGWWLAVAFRQGNTTDQSTCELWHDAPSQDVATLLGQGYVGLPLNTLAGIRARRITTTLPPPPSAETGRISIDANTVRIWTMLRGEADNDTRTYPDGHPARYAPEAMLRIDLEASYRLEGN